MSLRTAVGLFFWELVLAFILLPQKFKIKITATEMRVGVRNWIERIRG